MSDLPSVTVRPLQEKDIDAVAAMEVKAWHEYYSQYEGFYNIVKGAVTEDKVAADWREFVARDQDAQGPMVLGDDREAFVVFLEGRPVGIGAVSAYKTGVEVWKPVDDYIRQPDGTLPRLAKYQNLYVHQDHRGYGVGHFLNLARADYMLAKGYTGLFLAPFADAAKTMAFHEKNGLIKVHEYLSLSTYADDRRVKIACMVNLDLEGMREHWRKQLDRKQAEGKAYQAAS